MAVNDFPKSARLLKSAEFERVFRRRLIVSDSRLVVYCARGVCDATRVGLVVSRKCGNAVVRNRWKRLLREAFRLERTELPLRLDLVVVPRSNAVPELAELQKSFQSLASKAAARLSSSGNESL